jgi:hypothetical protein
MKNTISVYIIVGFLLSSFAGCGKLMNIVGLNQSEPSNTSIRDLTEEEISERFQREVEETFQRELKLFDPKNTYGADSLKLVIDHRNSLVYKLLCTKADYYRHIKEGKNVAGSTELQNISQI